MYEYIVYKYVNPPINRNAWMTWSDLQCPQRQRPFHPDDQFPAERKVKEYKTKIKQRPPKWTKYKMNAICNWTTVGCPAANVFILSQESNIPTVRCKFTASLWENGAFLPKDTLVWSWLLACRRSDLLKAFAAWEQEAAYPFPELTLSGSLFIWSQSLASVTSHQLDQ